MKGHNQHIYIVRHFFDKRYNTDYLLSTGYDKKAIVWKYNTQNKEFSTFLTIHTGHSGLYLYSGIILFDHLSPEKNYIHNSTVITSVPNEQLKVFNFNGTLIKHIGNKSDYTYLINSYFSIKNNCYYIINANSQDVKIIDYKTGTTVKTFKESTVTWHMSAFIATLNGVEYLFESDGNGIVRLWDFDTEIMTKKISIKSCSIRGILLWNEKYMVCACSDKTFKFINLETETMEHSQDSHENVLCTIQKIVHPTYGESLLSCAIDGKLKLWTS